MVYFVTSNARKFQNAERILNSFDVSIQNKDVPLYEIQSDDIEKIVIHKAHQAFEIMNTPLLITDHGWSIPGLNGFPGPYMKYMNQWLSAQNFLDLTYPLTDRRIILNEVVCFIDRETYKLFNKTHEGTLLKEIKGDPTLYPAMTISSFIPGISEAESIKEGKHSFDSTSLWEEVATYLKERKL